MNRFKEAKVILLSAEVFSDSCIVIGDTKNLKMKKVESAKDKEWDTFGNPQHMYLVSEGVIREGDWVYDFEKGVVHKCQNVSTADYMNSVKEQDSVGHLRNKIIATTDTSLVNSCNCDCSTYEDEPDFQCNCKSGNLPSPSKEFIEEYTKAYNCGDIISDVLVEYEEYTLQYLKMPQQKLMRIKIKEGVVNIRKLKVIWSREEVKVLLRNITWVNIENRTDFNRWIDENL